MNINIKNNWQQALKNLVTDPQVLLQLLELDEELLPAAKAAAATFPLKVPKTFVERMEKGNPNDPLLLQVLPLNQELFSPQGYHTDPVAEQNANPIPGLLHKYHGRVLITLSGACGIHCRYCFRRHFPYADNNPGKQGWEKIFAYLRDDKSIHEVILSGGDPLVVSDVMLGDFIKQLETIPHIRLLRIHTRLPIVIPQRITTELLIALTSTRLQIVFVVHVNHAQEINDGVKASLDKIRSHNMTLLNQTVLLKGINDNLKTLVDLSYALFCAGILPYYLHVLDKVQGAAHFDLPESQALKLHQAMQAQLPGYLVPRLVREVPGATNKISLSI